MGIGSPKTAAADPVGGESDVITTAAPRRVESPAAADGSIAFSQGSYSPQRAGFARLVFDNRYSRINGKHISFAVQVVGQDVIQVRCRSLSRYIIF